MKAQIKDLLRKDIKLLEDIIEDINKQDDSLDYLKVYENDEYFFNTFFSRNPMKAVKAAVKGDYDYDDDYVIITEDDTLESLDEDKYIKLLHANVDDVIEKMIKHKDKLCIYDEELEKLLSK